MVQPEPQTVSVRLDDMLRSYTKSLSNLHFVIHAKLGDLVSGTPAKLVQEGANSETISYRFAPFLVDDTDNISVAQIPSPQQQGYSTNTLDKAISHTTPGSWVFQLSTKTTDDTLCDDADKDLIIFEKEEEQQQGSRTTVHQTPLAVVSNAQQKQKQQQQQQRVKRPKKVPLFKPPRQQQQQSIASTSAPAQTNDVIAEKLNNSTLFKLPTKSIVTIKKPADTTNKDKSPSFNVDAAPFTLTSTPSSPATASFNIDAAPFTPTATTFTPPVPEENGKDSSTSTTTSSPPTIYNVKAASFIPTTDAEPIVDEGSNDSTTTTPILLLDIQTPLITALSSSLLKTSSPEMNNGYDETSTSHNPSSPSSTTPLNTKAAAFIPNDSHDSPSSSLNAQASVFTPILSNCSATTQETTTVEADMISLNVMAMPYLPPTSTSTSTSITTSSSTDDGLVALTIMNPSAPIFCPTSSSSTTFSPSLSFLPLHSSSTSSCASSTTDEYHAYPTHQGVSSPKSDTPQAQPSTVASRLNSNAPTFSSDADLIDLSMDQKAGW